MNLLWLSTSNDYNFDFSKKCRLKTCKLNIFRLIDPIFPYSSSLTLFRPLMIFDHPNWPQITLNLNSSQNFESKHMYFVYILTKIYRLTKISPRFDRFDLWWPLKGHDIDIFGISRKNAIHWYVFHQDLSVFSSKSQFRSISGLLTSIWPLKGQNSTKPRADLKSSLFFLTTSGVKSGDSLWVIFQASALFIECFRKILDSSS